MMVSEGLPESTITSSPEIINIPPSMIDKLMTLPTVAPESLPTIDTQNSIAPIKIPLVSFQPILATSPDYVLTNEFTKRKNQLVLFDDQLQRITVRSPIQEPVLDALWYENQQEFLLLTSMNVYEFNPNTKHIKASSDLIPIPNNNFQCFTLLNRSTLLIAYNQWGTTNIDKWQQDEKDGIWKLIDRQPFRLTCNEFVGSIITIKENGCSQLVATIYNKLTEQWRIDIRDIDTQICIQAILLPDLNIADDYRMIEIKNTQSGIRLLAFSSTNANIIAIDSLWKKIYLNYKHPVRRMAVFKDNYLIVRTTERVDVHSFI